MFSIRYFRFFDNFFFIKFLKSEVGFEPAITCYETENVFSIRCFRFYDNFLYFKILKSEVGFEPATFALRARRLTTRPLRRTEALQIYRLHSTMIEMTIRYAIC